MTQPQTDQALQTLDVAALELRRDEIETAIARIRGQIEHARSQVWTTGEYSDPNWYARARAALRFKGIEHQQILRALAERRREQRREAAAGQDRRFERAFISAARRRLTPELYRELIEEARAASAEADA